MGRSNDVRLIEKADRDLQGFQIKPLNEEQRQSFIKAALDEPPVVRRVVTTQPIVIERATDEGAP